MRAEFFDRAGELLCMVSFDGYFVDLNDRWEAVFGFSRIQLCAMPLHTWAHPDDREAVVAAIAGFRADSESTTFESRQLCSSGEYRWLRWTYCTDASRHSLFAVARDVTEARRELDMYRRAIEAAPTGILVVNGDGEIVLVNRHVEALFGYGRNELIGQPLLTLVPAAKRNDHQRWSRMYFATPDTRPMGAGRELFGVRKDGGQVPLEIGLNPMVTAEGTFVLASIVDISARRRQEAEVQGHLAELQRHRREMTALGELSALLQHVEAPGEPQRLVSAYAERLFPGVGLGVYLYPPSDRDLELTTSAGGFGGAERITTTDCWALRRGQLHRSAGDPRCAHAGPEADVQLCIPISAHGHTFGVLTLTVARGVAPFETLESVCRGVADQLALAISHLELRERLRRLSIRDPLTDLYNRRFLEEAVEHELARARRNGQPVAVLMLDIDHFKRFNDEHGHPEADSALRELGRLLLSLCRTEDVVCRYGGEEFVIMVPGVAAVPAVALAERMCGCVERTMRRLTVSIGVATFPEDGDRWATVFAQADARVYAAKREGRNRVVGPRAEG